MSDNLVVAGSLPSVESLPTVCSRPPPSATDDGKLERGGELWVDLRSSEANLRSSGPWVFGSLSRPAPLPAGGHLDVAGAGGHLFAAFSWFLQICGG